MKDRSALRDPLSVRLGGPAANLWTAADAQPDMQAMLVQCQRDLARRHLRWDEIWSDPERRAEAARTAGLWSRRILEKSGLLKSPRRRTCKV